MRTLFTSFSTLLIWLLLFSFDSVSAQSEKQIYQSLQHALFSTSQLSGENGPQNVTWIDGGARFSYMNYDPEIQANEIRVYNPETQEDDLVFDSSFHIFPDTDKPFRFESFQWSADYQFLVFQTNFTPIYRNSGTSDYYYYSLKDDNLQPITKSAYTAELSPDGKKVGYHKKGDMYVFDLATETETQLTHDADNNFYNGRFGWVYEEEFGKVQAWSWSPDSRYIAFWQTDERHVDRFISTDYEGNQPEYTDIPYPKVGGENPGVKIGVVDTETGDNQWMDLDYEDTLIPRIYWTAEENQLAVVWMNRQQNHLKLFFHNVADGVGTLIMEENSTDGWIDISNYFAGIEDHFFFPENIEEFFWISDREGYKHLYRYNYHGELLNQVTNGEWQVTNVFAIHSEQQRIFYQSTEVSPLERHLYSIQFDGSDKKKHTNSEGVHNISMGQNGQYYIDSWSNVDTPTQVELWTTKGRGNMLKKLVDNKTVQTYISEYQYSPRELFKFTTSKGNPLDGYVVRPPDFDIEKSYPLIMTVYGGPGSQGVTNEFETNAWVQYLAQQGYIVANVNNRGSGGYSRDFEKSVYKNLGKNEAEDFAETARYLASFDWIDGSQMAIRGHSYGGYMAALTMVRYPNLFKVGLVGAPVTDWRLYDTIYTERYMGLLEDNFENYREGSIMQHARNFRGNMLVAHSSMDENVHLQNTMQMVTAFTNAGKDIDLRIYPKGAHGVAYNQQSYLLLYQLYTNYLNRHLKKNS